MKAEEVANAAARCAQLRTVFHVAEDRLLSEMLEDVVRAARRYVGAVVRQEARQAYARRMHDQDRGAYRSLVEPADEARSRAHEALISGLTAFNRTAAERHGWEPEGRIPVGGLFTLDPECLAAPRVHRATIGDWALLLSLGPWKDRLPDSAWDPERSLRDDPDHLLHLANLSADYVCLPEERKAAFAALERVTPHSESTAIAVVTRIFEGRTR